MACCSCCCEAKTPPGVCCGNECCTDPDVCCSEVCCKVVECKQCVDGECGPVCQESETCCEGVCCAEGQACCDGVCKDPPCVEPPPPPPTNRCCLVNGACTPSQSCSTEPLGDFVGSVTVTWCGVSYTFDYSDLYSVLEGFCNWALGPEEGTPTGYEDGNCTSICWFNESQVARYKEEQAFMVITNDCVTGECTPLTRTCQPCDRVRFLIGTSLRGVMFFDGFAGGNVGYDFLSGGSKVWLYKQDRCGRATITLLSQDNCIPCGSVRDACTDPNASCPPDRPSFGNAACDTEPTVSLNEAP